MWKTLKEWPQKVELTLTNWKTRESGHKKLKANRFPIFSGNTQITSRISPQI